MATLSTLQQRYLDLIGDSDGTIDAFGTRNINLAIKDIINRYSFSWDITNTNLTLSSGAADLPSDFNPVWGIQDARIVNSSTADDFIFTQIPIWDKDKYDEYSYVYWITYDNTGGSENYVFNTHTQTGTVTIYYSFTPSDLSSGTDVCVVPDTEAVSYLAASKNWIGSERDIQLQQRYEQIADRYITAMYIRDLQSGPEITRKSVVSLNGGLGGSDNTWIEYHA